MTVLNEFPIQYTSIGLVKHYTDEGIRNTELLLALLQASKGGLTVGYTIVIMAILVYLMLLLLHKEMRLTQVFNLLNCSMDWYAIQFRF